MLSGRIPDVKLLLEGEHLNKVQSRIDSLLLSDVDERRVMNTLYGEMWQGLHRDHAEQRKASLKMENTYVRSLIDGTETGDFLALDLGGTNLRVLLVTLRAGRCQSISKHYSIPTATLHGPAEGVFDHLAASVHKFIVEHKLNDRRLPLGFTFSFPMIHHSLRSGILISWTKSFTCSDGPGQDAVVMLEEAIRRHGDITVDVVAVLNDTTGTLLAGSYLDKHCQIGLIMGTGSNAAYVEDLDNVDKWVYEFGEMEDSKGHQVVINIEWGAFGDNGSLEFLRTKYDKRVDEISSHKGTYTFEKLFAAHYVGDLVSVVLLDLAEEGLIFGGQVPKKLLHRGSIKAAHVSSVERDTEENTANTENLLNDLDIGEYASFADKSVIRYLCSAVSIRGAQLISAAISVLLNHMRREKMTVAVDGSYYKHHPKLHGMMTAWCKQLAPNTETKFILAEDGSGRGAAFVAAVAESLLDK